MTLLSFSKMHGAGNDCVIIDNRAGTYHIGPDEAARLSHRQLGIGCDQLVVLTPSQQADVWMTIYNADGSEIDACGNATRCVAWRVMVEQAGDKADVETRAGVLHCHKAGEHLVTVDMGAPRVAWRDIPLTEARNTEHLGLSEGPLMDPVAVNIGNPHMVFFVKDVDYINMTQLGPKLEHHPLYARGCNVSAAQMLARDHIRLKVWERGSGETLACGTAACAAAVAAVQRGLGERRITVSLPGGDLLIEWSQASDQIAMSGPVVHVFDGQIDLGMV